MLLISFIAFWVIIVIPFISGHNHKSQSTVSHSLVHSNELNQLHYYLEALSMIYPYNSSQWEAYHERINHCLVNSNQNCFSELRGVERSDVSRPTPWHHTIVNDRAVQYTVDCLYDIDHYAIEKGDIFVEYQDHIMIGLTIHQHSCRHNSSSFLPIANVNTSAVELLFGHGGSSFDVLFESDGYLSSCITEDHFNGSYLVLCPVQPPLPLSIPMEQRHRKLHQWEGKHSSGPVCGNITITLQYEHFDAFDVIGVENFVSLNKVLIEKMICYNTASMPEMWYRAGSFPIKWRSSHINNSAEEVTQLIHEQSSTGAYTTNTVHETSVHQLFHNHHNVWLNSNLSYPPHVASLSKYTWKQSSLQFLTISSFMEGLKYIDRISIIGPSHMRFNFDYFLSIYIQDIIADRKHDERVIADKYYYLPTKYASDYGPRLDKIECHKSQIVVMQLGAWDIQTFGVSGFITSPLLGQSFIHALQRFKARGCDENVSIILLTTVPHPNCRNYDITCIRAMNYFRNNPSMLAYNQYLMKEIPKIGLSRMTIIDTTPIILPRLYKDDEDITCVNHYLCCEQGRMEHTMAGVTVAMELMYEIFELSLQYHPPVVRDKLQLESFPNFYLFRVISDKKYFIIHHGCYREFPDLETIEQLGLHIYSFDTRDLRTEYRPCYAVAKFPSRKNGVAIQSPPDRTVYYMDMGYRRAVYDRNVFVALGLDFDNVQYVNRDDTREIPEGGMIYSVNDVNHINSNVNH